MRPGPSFGLPHSYTCIIIVLMNRPRNKALGPAMVVLMTVLAVTASATDAPRRYTGQTYQQLTTPPPDSADAANVRVWLALERPNLCRVGVQIVDLRGNAIRNIFDGLLPGGYYNFYWDKRNDLGRYVDTGVYTFKVDDECSETRRGQVRATYKEWENACLFYPPPDDNGSWIEYYSGATHWFRPFSRTHLWPGGDTSFRRRPTRRCRREGTSPG
jgi:hypothetical protein